MLVTIVSSANNNVHLMFSFEKYQKKKSDYTMKIVCTYMHLGVEATFLEETIATG